MTQENFITRCSKEHNNFYDYSEVCYMGVRTKIKIICPNHGPFEQTAFRHLHGSGCRLCNLERKKWGGMPLTNETFKERANQIHNNYYNYDKVEYKGCQRKVKIICPKHGAFWQLARAHLDHRGCAKCASYKRGPKKHWTPEQDEFLIKNYREIGVKDCARQLNKTTNQVIYRAKLLKIPVLRTHLSSLIKSTPRSKRKDLDICKTFS